MGEFVWGMLYSFFARRPTERICASSGVDSQQVDWSFSMISKILIDPIREALDRLSSYVRKNGRWRRA